MTKPPPGLHSGRAVATERPEPEPLPVAYLRFVRPMSAAGLNVASSASDCVHSKQKQSRLRLYYLPWMRHFRVEFARDPGTAPDVSFIHEAEVMSWDPPGASPRP